MNENRIDNIVIRDARIIRKNFRGEKTEFNSAGMRSFGVVIDDPEMAERLIADGWNLRLMKPREEGDDPHWSLDVRVSYNRVPPKIVTITSRKKTPLTEDTVATLDSIRFLKANVAISPSFWRMSGRQGIKAYLKTLYVEIEEDEFEAEYEDIGNALYPLIDED